jgi:medium-chain acyl-[acyl-carrier-protein] hydrolase
MPGKALEREYEIHYYEVDYSKKVLLTSLINYFGDMAIKQAESNGIGLDYLAENNLGWVLYKWDIQIDKYPKLGECIKIKTYAYSIKKFYAYRYFEVRDSSGQLICIAKSLWFLVNTVKKRPVRVSEHICEAFGVIPDDGEILEFRNMQPIGRIDSEQKFNVRYEDIDTNQHVNNSKYVSWVLETVPLSIVMNYTLTNIRITYEKETKYGEMVQVETQLNNTSEQGKDAATCLHKILDSQGKELTLAESQWVKNIQITKEAPRPAILPDVQAH